MLYWLDHGFLTDGYEYNGVTYKLPNGIINNLKTIDWQFEPVNLGTGVAIPQEGMEAKVSLLSLTEYKKYSSIIGFDDGLDSKVSENDEWGGWHTRTLTTGSYTDTRIFISRQGATWGYGGATAFAIRPCFYLNSDFALKVKIDVASLGSEVKKFIKDAYDRSELEEANLGYTEAELDEIFGVQDAEVTGFKFRDSSNNDVTALTGGANVKAVYTVKNRIETPVPAMAIIASYDKTTGQLLSTAYTETPVSIAAGESVTVESPVITLPSDVSNVIVKGFIWSGFDTMKPISNTVHTLPNTQ